MRTLDIIELVYVFAAPTGFALSLIAAVTLLSGKARLLAVAALGLALLSTVAFVYANQQPYSARRQLEALGFAAAFSSFFAIYLRHTYFPTTLKWVNLPATLGFGVSIVFLTLYLLVKL